MMRWSCDGNGVGTDWLAVKFGDVLWTSGIQLKANCTWLMIYSVMKKVSLLLLFFMSPTTILFFPQLNEDSLPLFSMWLPNFSSFFQVLLGRRYSRFSCDTSPLPPPLPSSQILSVPVAPTERQEEGGEKYSSGWALPWIPPTQFIRRFNLVSSVPSICQGAPTEWPGVSRPWFWWNCLFSLQTTALVGRGSGCCLWPSCVLSVNSMICI